MHLNTEQQKGRELFSHTCSLCHTLQATNSIARIGPNLDVRVGDDIPTPAGRRALVLGAILEGRARGLGQMPALLYQRQGSRRRRPVSWPRSPVIEPPPVWPGVDGANPPAIH